MKHVFLIVSSFLLAGCSDSNEVFGKKVEQHMAEIAKNNAARQAAQDLCRPLPEERRSKEAQCVALQNEARSNMYRVPAASDPSKDKGWAAEATK